MSGGSWDYIYSKLQELGDELAESRIPHRRLLGEKMQKIAQVMYTIEWIDSGDYSKDRESEVKDAIVALFGENEIDHILMNDVVSAFRAVIDHWQSKEGTQ